VTEQNSSLASLLTDLGVARVELAVHPEDPTRVRFRPADAPEWLVARLRLHRSEVIELLSVGYQPATGSEAEYRLGERLGIADGLGLPAVPGSPAWLVAVGEAMEHSCSMTTHTLGCGHGKAA
jgi:hypothetical protein